MNISQIEKQLYLQHAYKNRQELQKILSILSKERSKMDRWFDKYLDIFSEKLEDCSQKDPIKVLYNKKFTEYQEVVRVIKATEYFIKVNK